MRRYGDRVTVDFHDIEKPETRERFADELDRAEERHLFFPLVIADGEIVPIEWFSAWTLVDVVEAKLRSAVGSSPSPA